jgi:hypothetical protein
MTPQERLKERLELVRKERSEIKQAVSNNYIDNLLTKEQELSARKQINAINKSMALRDKDLNTRDCRCSRSKR